MNEAEAVGIIPAHAGFTVRRTGWRGRLKDHPRTRGVYQVSRYERSSSEGSSPHTRGLLTGESRLRGLRGIIPAHAGFTSVSSSPLSLTWDHPRTRGVYRARTADPYPDAGSSPHTRGLLPRIHLDIVVLRIIPAHAGFTHHHTARRPRNPDHPRTRGVYGPNGPSPATSLGSSPHTRGLPVPAQAPVVTARIIPAHAGFTR